MTRSSLPENIDMKRSDVKKALNKSQGLSKRVAEKLEINNLIDQEIWHFLTNSMMFFNDLNSSGLFAYIDTVDNETFNACQSFLTTGRLPQKPNEVIFIVEKQRFKYYDVEVGDEIQLSAEIYDQKSQKTQNATAIIAGIIIYNALDRFSLSNEERSEFWKYFEWNSVRTILLTLQSSFIEFMTTFYTNRTFFYSAFNLINVDVIQLDAFNIGAEKARLERFQHELELECDLLGYSFKVKSPLISAIRSFEYQFTQTIFFMFLFSLPSLIMTFFLGIFSLGLLKRKRRLQIGILKTRGASSSQIFVILLGESLIITFISICAGTTVGLPFAFVTLHSKELLIFTGGAIPLVVSPVVFQVVLLFGILFALLFNFLTIFQLVKTEIKESVLPRDVGKPRWKKYYLDVIVFSLGMVDVIFLYYVRTLAAGAHSSLDPFFISLATLFGLASPIFVTIGGAMLSTRLLPPLLKVASRWTWKLEGGFIALSFRNMLNWISPATRAILLLSVVLAFSIALLAIPHNTDANVKENSYYHSLGADMIITSTELSFNETLSLNQTLLNYLRNNLTGIASISPVAQISAPTSRVSLLNIFGVDINTFAQTAFFREDFLNSDALSSLTRLNIPTAAESILQGDVIPDNPGLTTLLDLLQSNRTILLQEDNLRGRDLNINNQLSVTLQNYTLASQNYSVPVTTHTTVIYEFDVVGTFKYWPLFISLPVSSYTQSLYMVASFSAVLEYANSAIFTPLALNYLIRVDPGVSSLQLKKQIVNETGADVQCIEEEIGRYMDSPARKILVTTINGSLLTLLTVATFTVLMFGFNRLTERNREIGVERALGMNLKQTLLLFVIEALILTFFGIVFGLILGMFIGQAFLATTLFVIGVLFPPFLIHYPWALIVIVSALIVIIGLISSFMPAFLATRTRISEILRIE